MECMQYVRYGMYPYNPDSLRPSCNICNDFMDLNICTLIQMDKCPHFKGQYKSLHGIMDDYHE